jgi:hypothetical protein
LFLAREDDLKFAGKPAALSLAIGQVFQILPLSKGPHL